MTPASLNDDYVRTFTVSSPPLPRIATTTMTNSNTTNCDHPSVGGSFDITFRNVGTVTSFLYRQDPRTGLEIPLRGFGGSFNVLDDLHHQRQQILETATAAAESSSGNPEKLEGTPSGTMETKVSFIAGRDRYHTSACPAVRAF